MMGDENMSFKITIRATSILITPGKEAMGHLQQLINLHTYEDEYQDITKTMGFLYDEQYDQLFFHKGIDIQYLKRLLPDSEIVNDPFDPYREMKYQFEEIIPPRDEDQQDCIDFIAGEGPHRTNIKDPQIFLVKKPGFGKAEPYSRKIPTPTKEGYTRMGDLKVGDYVFDEDGTPTQITAIFDQGVQDVYRITFEDGREAYCVKEHLWKVRTRTSDWTVMTLAEMMDVPTAEYEIPLCNPVEYILENNIPWVDELSYIFASGMIAKQGPDGMPYGVYAESLHITKIEKCGRELCRCIMVENPEHLYLTEDFIVTHNTFCTGYGVGLYGVKVLIIMHRDNLRGQWLDSLYHMNGYDDRVVHEITSTDEIVAIAHNRHNYDYDIYLMTHATFRAGLKRLADTKLIGNITRNLGIGFKVIDEAHLEFRDTLLIDFLFNVKRNLYLTATDGRSVKDEDSIFRHVFSHTTFYKKTVDADLKHPDKWVDYTTIFVNTHVNPNIYRYRIAGGRGMSTATYGKWVIQHDKTQQHFKAIITILRDIYNEEPSAKVLVFLPLIDLCTECSYFIAKELNYDESFEYDLNVKTVNSHNSKHENELNKHADVIVTTIQSLGTGSDIKGVTSIINCTPIVSKIVVQQVLGRIRYIEKHCHYYDIVDKSVQMDLFWWKSRSKTFKRLCTRHQEFEFVDDSKGEKENDPT